MMVERETIQKGLELPMAAGLGTIGLWFGSAPTEVMIAVGAGMGASWLLNLTEASVQQVGRDVAQMRVTLNKIIARQERGTDDAPHVQAFVQALLPLLSQELMRQLRDIKDNTSDIKGDTSDIKASIVVLLNKVESLRIAPPSPTAKSER